MRGPSRHGFSLLEVLLATSILIGSAIVLVELVTIGNRHASSARELSKSQLICETKLNEILAHAAPVAQVRPTPSEEDPRWVVWIDLIPTVHEGLVALEVNAAYEPTPKKQRSRCTLVRWVRDPKSKSNPAPQSPAPDATLGEGAVAGGPAP
jgi:general secretion pathway protein I